MNLPTTLTGITIIGSTLHWDIYPQLNIVKIPLKKLFSLVLTIHFMILLMIESLWRGSLIEGIKFITINYLIMIVNLIIIMIFFAAILIVKRKISFVIEMSFILLLGAIFNKYVFIFRGTPLNMNDLSMIIEAINIVNKYFNKKIIIFSLLTFICLGIFGSRSIFWTQKS